mmetsp:Transcript_11510/g.24246  ORF Transcript_11510/g.24246 Transcript_11510/m.24246 type:complete len:264 (+) Transcript_11510:258-1049(+)
MLASCLPRFLHRPLLPPPSSHSFLLLPPLSLLPFLHPIAALPLALAFASPPLPLPGPPPSGPRRHVDPRLGPRPPPRELSQRPGGAREERPGREIDARSVPSVGGSALSVAHQLEVGGAHRSREWEWECHRRNGGMGIGIGIGIGILPPPRHDGGGNVPSPRIEIERSKDRLLRRFSDHVAIRIVFEFDGNVLRDVVVFGESVVVAVSFVDRVSDDGRRRGRERVVEHHHSDIHAKGYGGIVPSARSQDGILFLRGASFVSPR